MSQSVSVVLVCMPWLSSHRPSAALGIVQACLDRAGVPAVTRSFHVSFVEHLLAATSGNELPLKVGQYERLGQVAVTNGAGDWVFAVPPYRELDQEKDQEFLRLLQNVQGVEDEDIVALSTMRELAPSFLEQCVAEILSLSPKIVGFTTGYGQTIPSLVLSKMLKIKDPGIATVFGGSNCQGTMGSAIHRSFPCVDFVVRGPCEEVFPRLVAEILAGCPPTPSPGLCLRRGDERIEVAEEPSTIRMVDVPTPNYDEFFQRFNSGTSGFYFKPMLPYESSRGCWWGAKHHCTFCGLNGRNMSFQSRPAEQAVQHLEGLIRRYQALDIEIVDNILDLSYFESLLPRLAEYGYDLSINLETKSNLRLRQVQALKKAGVNSIVPGIESLSTPILQLMRKGVSELHNIRFLKWCATYDIRPYWQILYGFPGEPESEYERMAMEIRGLVHLPPPDVSPIFLDRYSPYFERPNQMGFATPLPRAYHRLLYDLDESTLLDLAYRFESRHLDGRNPNSYTGSMRRAAEQWKANHRKAMLTCSVGPDFVQIVDRRADDGSGARYLLESNEAEIYMACDAGATPSSILRSTPALAGKGLSLEDVRNFLESLREARLVYREGQNYLSLAVPKDPSTYFRRCVQPSEPNARVDSPKLTLLPVVQ